MKLKVTTIAILAFLVLGGGGIFYYSNHSKDAQTQEQTASNTVANQQTTLQVSEDGQNLAYQGVSGETALTTLKKLTDVQTKSSDFGEYVVSIGGLSSDSAQNYWAFYVNGKLAQVGAGSYYPQAGETIEWKLENL